jgi:predicted nucleic acid-binding protein
MAAFLVDTDVLIDISRGNRHAADFVDALPGDIFIGRISAMELIVGARNKRDQKVIEQFISLYSIKELSEAIGHEAHQRLKQYAKSHGLTLADALIAATAIANDLVLVSKNEKHFQPIKELGFSKANY